MNHLVKLLTLVLLFLPIIAAAQPDPPCNGCPIDGGLGFLIAAGIAYGGKKALDLKNKS